jgi:hypothetical protein
MFVTFHESGTKYPDKKNECSLNEKTKGGTIEMVYCKRITDYEACLIQARSQRIKIKCRKHILRVIIGILEPLKLKVK